MRIFYPMIYAAHLCLPYNEELGFGLVVVDIIGVMHITNKKTKKKKSDQEPFALRNDPNYRLQKWEAALCQATSQDL